MIPLASFSLFNIWNLIYLQVFHIKTFFDEVEVVIFLLNFIQYFSWEATDVW